MAIRGHNHLQYVSPIYFSADTLVAEAGAPVVLQTPSGASGKPGDSANAVVLPEGAADEVFVGILFENVVSWNHSTCCFVLDQYQNATTQCRPVAVIRQGDVLTDQVDLASNPIAGATAYLGTGVFTATQVSGVVAGTFLGKPDANGFVPVHIDV